MNINEIFLSIQGESTFSGLPCIFVRFCNCNLNCSYCDTKYNTEINLTLDTIQLIEYIKKYHPVKLIELTGGEPLLQPDLPDLCDKLIDRGYEVLIETNGSLNLKQINHKVHKIIDVKCPDSGEGSSFLIENLNYFKPDRDNLKFVISSLIDYEFAKNFLVKHSVSGPSVLFSGVSDRIEAKQLAEEITKDRLDVRFQLQLHKYIWDPDKRGV